MNKLFNSTQAKGKWHKFISFDLGRGAKLYKNFAQKLLAVSLCMAMVLLGTPVTTFADLHEHTKEYSGTKGDADCCLVCDVATKVNNLYGDSVDEITVENAAKVISQIHAIDQIKFELDNTQYEELIALTDGWSGGDYGELPSKYFKAKEKIDELGLTGGWLDVDKNVLGVGEDRALDLSEARVSLEVTPVEAADGTYVAMSDAETMNLDMYGMYDNFSMVLNEATPDFRGQRSFYKRYDVNAGVIDNVNNNGWTTSFLLPAGTYRIREVNREAPMIVDGEEFHTGSTTYTYNGASTTSVVGEDDPGVVVQVTAGGVTPVTLVNYSTGSLTVSCAVDSPLASDEEKEFEFTVRLAYPTDPHLATELYEISLPSGTFGDMTFEGGVARFTLKNGESKTATRLPYWFGYTVESTAVDGFTVVSEGSAGTVEPSGQHEATFTFTRKTGDLAVSCTVDSHLESDKERDFPFTVTLDDATINGAYGNMEFKDGVATVTLKGGESKTFGGLPEGTGYTVTSAAADGFTVESEGSEGTIERDGAAEARFTFTRETVPVTGVTLSETALELAVGAEETLTAEVSPGNATNKNVTWMSGDPSVATVDANGKVTAVGSGKTIITVTTQTNNKTAECEVTVKEKPALSVTSEPAGSSVFFTVSLPEDATGTLVGSISHKTFSVEVEGGGPWAIIVTNLPTGSHDYTLSYSGDSKYAAAARSGSVTIPGSSLAPFFSSLPAALPGLTFNDTSQQLISAGTLHSSLAGCHVEYAVVETCPAEDSPFWSDSLPMGTGAGTYKVWYRVVDSTSKAVLGVSAEPISVTIAPRSLADADIRVAGGPHYYTGSEVTPAVSVSLTGFGLLTDGTDYDVSYSNNTNAGTATVTVTGWGDFIGTVSETFTITKATPDSSGLTTSLDAFYGQTLAELLGRLAKPKDLKGNTLEGSWSWADKDGKPLSDDTKVGSVGEHTYTAVFIPTNGNYSTVEIIVTVKVSVDTSKWGDAHERPGDKKTQYVDQAGKTSIEVKVDNLSAGSVLWLFEESYGTSAWYGLDLSADAFALDKGLRFYVQWVSPDDAEYNTYYSQLDDAQKARVEGDNGWIFLIGVEDPEGNKVQPAQPVSVYVQLGKDWDPEHLNAYYISTGADVGVPIKNLILYFPGGSGIFGCMTLSHFSPYFIFDELTDEEKAALNSGNVKTGDIATQITVAGLGMTLVLALGIMLKLITSKRKFEE